jgi:predicted aconitase with swiveling domain
MAVNRAITDNEGKTLRKAALAAGIAYLFALVQGFALAPPANSLLIIPGNISATAISIASHESLYRISVLGELAMYASVIVLAVALYVILKTVNKNLALLALSFRLAEAIVSVAAVFASLIVLEFLGTTASMFGTEHSQALIQTFLDAHTVGARVGLLFTGLGSIIFYYLFSKSIYIPKVFSILGIAAYLLLLTATAVDLLTPRSTSRSLLISAIEFAPAVLFETAMGLWFLVKRVKVQA